MEQAPTLGQVLADRVRHYRDESLQWTQEELAAETEKLGHKLNRVTIAKIESGGTRAANISLVDTMVLAAALNVPPPLLFLPLGQEERVAITPTVRVHPHLVLDWITGEGPFVYENRRARDLRTWNRHTEPMWMFQRLRDLQEQVHSTESIARTREEGETPSQELADERYDGALRQLEQHLEYMERVGLRTPQMPDAWLDRLAEIDNQRREAQR